MVDIDCLLRTVARAGTVHVRPITKASDVPRLTLGVGRVKSNAGDSAKKIVESGNGTKMVNTEKTFRE